MGGRSRRESVCVSTTVAALPAVCVDVSEQPLSTLPAGEQLWQRRDGVGWGELRRRVHRRGPAHTRLPAWGPAFPLALMFSCITSYPELKSRKLHLCKSTWR